MTASFQTENGEIGVFTYEKTSDGVALTNFEYGRIALEIPGEIDGKPVVGIGSGAFSSDGFLSLIYLPDSVTTINSKAFSNCKNLDAVYYMGDPDKLSYDETVFEGASVQNFNTYFPADADTYFCSAGFDYGEAEDGQGIIIDGYTADVAFDIPDEINGSKVTEIRENLFINNIYMSSVDIPDYVTEIDPYAFSGCTNLVSVELPAAVTEIGDHAFFNCESLKSITVSGGNGIADGADLSGISEIGEWAFGGCESLPAVTFSDRLNTIKFGAFSRCNGLGDVFIPSSVTTLESCSFYRCSSLESISVDEENSNFSSLDGVLFNKKQTEILAYPPGKMENYNIPATVKTLGEYSFYNCPSPIIPKSVNRIKHKALEGTGIEVKDSLSVWVDL